MLQFDFQTQNIVGRTHQYDVSEMQVVSNSPAMHLMIMRSSNYATNFQIYGLDTKE